MAHLKLRDRDAIVTREGLIFRVLGYTHPPGGYICDAEYAPPQVFESSNPKAPRGYGRTVFYKFYGDEGWRLIREKFPHHMLLHKPLGKKVLGVKCGNIAEVRRPEEILHRIAGSKPRDKLLEALQRILKIIVEDYGLPLRGFGVFGSILHGFHHPNFSDIDMTVYGEKNLRKLRGVLRELYSDKSSNLSNEFENENFILHVMRKTWRFKNLSPKEFIWHQRRKLIYGVFQDETLRRTIKVEFEPIKSWSEIRNEYPSLRRIVRKGWIKAILRVKGDSEGAYMPSVYYVEPLKIVDGPRADDIVRVVSYLEEFRMQCWRDEVVYVEGNLELVETRSENFHQITLTYGPRYYEQTLKTVRAVDSSLF